VTAARFSVPAALSVALLTSHEAHAFHTQNQRITDDTAYTLRRRDLRLGLWKAQYGVFEPLLVGTHLWPWLFRTANLHLKWRYFQSDSVALAVAAGFFHLSTESFSDLDDEAGDAKLSVVPFELAASFRIDDRFTWSVAPVWTQVAVDGALDGDAFKGAARGAVNNLQLTSTFEWRVSRVTALTAHWRHLVFQRTTLSGDFVSHPDAFTTVEVKAAGLTDDFDFKAASSLTLSSIFSWETFNLRLGLGYGNYSVPGLNFVLAEPIWFPDLDLYWIF
jgi:hypothetical protein